MNRKTQIIIFAIVSIVALIWCYYSGTTENAANREEQINDTDTENVANREEQTNDTVTEETSNRTIQDVVNSQANNEEYKFVGSFHEGLAYASKESERSILGIYGYIDEEGNEAIEFRYRIVHDFSEGLAVVSEDAEKFGYIDHQGNWVIEPILDRAGDFRHGKATVQVGIKQYVIDQEGNVLEEVKSD